VLERLRGFHDYRFLPFLQLFSLLLKGKVNGEAILVLTSISICCIFGPLVKFMFTIFFPVRLLTFLSRVYFFLEITFILMVQALRSNSFLKTINS